MSGSEKSKSSKVVPGYEREPMRQKVKLVTEEYEYELPFNYPNVTVKRHQYYGSEFHGIEMNAVNSISGQPDYKPMPADAIIVEEPHPIVRVVVIGSACTAPGYVQIECEPIEGWRRPDEIESVMPVRMRINGLWGMHLRYDAWFSKQEQVKDPDGNDSYEKIPQGLIDIYPHLAEGCMRTHFREWPTAGMSSAIFEIPPSKNVTVMGGGETPGWRSDSFPDDLHYSFRMIRTTVRVG